MKDRKAAKLIIKRAKKNPEMYSKEEVRFAKAFRKRLKQEKKEQSGECLEIITLLYKISINLILSLYSLHTCSQLPLFSFSSCFILFLIILA